MTSTKAKVANLRGFDSFEQRLGDELRGERATLGKSLLDVQRDLRIKASYIAAIENCDLSVFENTGFLAGYVRSYARYLALDPEHTYARFCVESNFKGAHADLGHRREDGAAGKLRVAAINASDAYDINPIFKGAVAGRSGGLDLSALGPLVVVLALIGGLAFGGWTLLKDIQRVDIAPIERAPVVLDAVANAGFSDSANKVGQELAAEQTLNVSRALAVPVVTPRDGPISAISPRMASSFMAPAAPAVDSQLIVAAVKSIASVGAPQVIVSRQKPLISLFAQQDAWVRVRAADGAVIFEKVLPAGKKYTLPARVDVASLRAGNASHLFLMVDGQVYGPLKGKNGVAKGVSLAAADITSKYAPLGTLTAQMQTVSQDLTRAASLGSQY